MAHSQLYPLEWNEQRGEPFLRLPTPHDNIIITPPRPEDKLPIVALLSDPRVYKTLSGPPFPYELKHAECWVNQVKQSSDELLHELKEAADQGASELKIVGGCPVRALREVRDDGTEIFLGDIGVHRAVYPDVVDEVERARLVAENEQIPIGDERIAWCIADYLAASYHGRGIMSAALGTLIKSWVVPRMQGRLIRAETFIGNKGSARVFEKNGFVYEKTVDYPKVIPCGETCLGFDVFWWRYEQQQR